MTKKVVCEVILIELFCKVMKIKYSNTVISIFIMHREKKKLASLYHPIVYHCLGYCTNIEWSSWFSSHNDLSKFLYSRLVHEYLIAPYAKMVES